MFNRTIMAQALSFLLAFLLVTPAFADGGDPRLEISVERVNPGGVVNVRGVAFEFEELVSLVLIGPGIELSLGKITANVEGEFTHIVVLPSDLPEGTYYFRGTTARRWVISPPLTVWGTAIIEGGGQGPRDEDDGLLAPMPTYPPAPQAVSTVSAPIASVPIEAPSVSSGWGTNILILAVLMVIAVGIMLSLGRKRAE
jgi:hypothetical protein